MAEAEASATAGTNTYLDGVSRIRETAKWLTVSLGSIGALLIGGIQLTGLGKLESDSSRFNDARYALALAVVGIAAILGGTAYTLTRRPAKISDITKFTSSDYPQFFASNSEQGIDLYNNYVEVSQRRSNAYQDYLDHRDDDEKLSEYKVAEARLRMYNNRVEGLTGAANYRIVSIAWRWTSLCVVLGTAAVIVVWPGLRGPLIRLKRQSLASNLQVYW